MRERDNKTPLTDVKEWFTLMDLGFMRKIDEISLDRAMSLFGARETLNSKDLRSLGNYNLFKAEDGMRAVWGEKRLDQFNDFLNRFIDNYDEEAKRIGSPKLKSSFSRAECVGMRRFYLKLTQVAFRKLNFQDFFEWTKAAIENGELFRENKAKRMIKLINPRSNGEPEVVSLIPSGFLPEFYKWLENLNNV